jgi:uncharacterized protein (DUF3084 family)
MYGIALILVIAAMGGAIAYIGDKLGSKVGKKKLSIFGLRPKHTSILVTIVTGILIAAVTLGTMSVVSENVRTALFGMEELQSQMFVLNKEVSDKTRELELSYAEIKSKNEEYASLTKETEETSERLKKIAEERDLASEELTSLQASYATAENEIQSLTVTKKGLDEKIQALGQERENLQTDIGSLQALAKNLQQGIQTVRGGTVVLRAGEVLSTTVLSAGQNAERAAYSLKTVIYQTNQGLLERFDVKDKRLDILWINQVDFDRALAELTHNNKDTIVRISTLGNTIYGEPIIGYINTFPNNLIYQKGEIIYAESFPGPTDSQQAEETILSFLHKVNNAAIEKGVLPDPLSGTVGSMSGAKLFDAINKIERAANHASPQGKIEIVAVATENISAVGPLNIDIRIRDVL